MPIHQRQHDYDVVVIGGGPAGSSVATMLSRYGYRVLVIERTRFPRYHIGESLIPFTYQVLHRLGALDKVRAARFVDKEGFQFTSRSGRLGRPFYFNDSIRDRQMMTWQVERDRFDQLLLEHSVSCGATLLEGASVTDFLLDGQRVVGVRYRTEDGAVHEARAPFVADCSGRSTLLSRRFGLIRRDPLLDQLAVWRYIKGAYRQPGRDEGNIVVAQLSPRGWFWWLPLRDDMTSIGVVSSARHLKEHGQTPSEQFERCLQLNPVILEWTSQGEWVGDYQCTGDYSYTSERFVGEGWLLVGDAGAFIDPVFSSGAWLAMVTGMLAADAIRDTMNGSASALADYEVLFRRGECTYRIFLDAFYDDNFSASTFLRKHPEWIPEWGRVLSGDVFDDNRQFNLFLMNYRRQLAEALGQPTRIFEPDGWKEDLASNGPDRLRPPFDFWSERLEPMDLPEQVRGLHAPPADGHLRDAVEPAL